MHFNRFVKSLFALGLASSSLPKMTQQNYDFNHLFQHQSPPSPKFFSQTMLFAGNSVRSLAHQVAAQLNIKQGNAHVSRFQDGECNIQVQILTKFFPFKILDNVRGRDVFLIQSVSQPVNDNLMELLLFVSALRRASAKSITVIIPYYAYSRQDHKLQKSQSIAAADIAKLLEASGIDRMVSIDLHRGQVQGFFSPQIPVDNLEPYSTLLAHFSTSDDLAPLQEKPLVIVSPDFNGVSRAKKFQDLLRKSFPQLRTKLAMIYKEKPDHPHLEAEEITQLVGDVKDKNCIIIDDIIDSGKTVRKAATALKEEGAGKILVFATHPVMSSAAAQNLNIPAINQVFTTNTIPIPNSNSYKNLVQLTVAPLIAEAILRIQQGQSVTELSELAPAPPSSKGL